MEATWGTLVPQWSSQSFPVTAESSLPAAGRWLGEISGVDQSLCSSVTDTTAVHWPQIKEEHETRSAALGCSEELQNPHPGQAEDFPGHILDQLD